MPTDIRHEHAIEIASAAVDTFIEHLNAWAGDDSIDPTRPYLWEAKLSERPNHLTLLRFVESEMRWWGFPDEDFISVYRIASTMFNRLAPAPH